MQVRGEGRRLGLSREMISPMLLLCASVIGQFYFAHKLYLHARDLEASLPTLEARRDELRASLQRERDTLKAAIAAAEEAGRLAAGCGQVAP